MADDIIQKTRKDYNKIAQQFSDTRNGGWPELEDFRKQIHNGQKILDWGCGNGRLLAMLKDYEIKYFGLDISSEFIRIARQKYAAEAASGKANFFLIDKREKNFPADYFDLAFLIASFHHLPDEKSRLRVLEKIYYELKPGGKILMTVWNLESRWARNKYQNCKISNNDYLIPWKNKQGQIECERYYHHFPKKELYDLLRRSKFRKIKLYYYLGCYAKEKSGSRNLIAIAEK